ncbi:MAG TPA: alpha/beta hydrolase [Polyangiaceae bacterium]|nr:alpha/beta hydrolase [Polyangiaceae bacterium]
MTGGAATGGTATGGVSTGGTSTGGASSGGTGSGGTGGNSGATGSGGAPPGGGTGGASGGAATGGMGTGGQKSGDAGAGGKATGGVAGAASGGAGGSGGAVGPTLPPITDYTAKGPFATKQESNVGPGGKYTVYRPDPLGKDGFVHAPIVFGPGIGQQVTVHNQMLTNFASHGFIVVGTPVLNGGPGDAANLKSMQDGLAWILQQNGVAGTYQGKVWVDHAISMGFSVGGTSAVQLGGEQAVATVVSIHGHNASAALHGPMLQTTGTNDTVGMPLQKQTYDKSMVQTFLATLTGAPHQYIESNGGGEERPAILAWMRYWIYRDEGAKKYFFGSDCVLCKAPWENPQRKNWP